MNKFIIKAIAFVIRFFSRNKLLILNYHRVHTQDELFFDSDIDIEEFNNQIKLLSENFNTFPLDKAVKLLKQKKLPSNSIVITFDDGYKDNIENALPILIKNNSSATFFIATGFLNDGIMWNDVIIESIKRTKKEVIDLSWLELGCLKIKNKREKIQAIENIISLVKYKNLSEREQIINKINKQCGVSLPDKLMMTDADVKLLYQSKMEIGGHTSKHPILKIESKEKVSQELIKGKKYLENLLNTTLTSFAYPNGKLDVDYSSRDVKLVSEAGFKYAVTTNWGVNTPHTDPFQLYRFTPWDKSPVLFMLRLLKLFVINRV